MADTSNIRSEADRCVKCGMCLQVCPTYRLRRQEAESPRGRIALAQALAEGQLAPSAGLVSHLDNCLQCRACEAICPSRVRYGALIAEARRLTRPRQRTGLALQAFWSLFERMLAQPARGSLIHVLFRLYQRLALSRGVVHGEGLALITVPAGSKTIASRVTLIPGCLQDSLDPELLPAALKVLSAMGLPARQPEFPLCCGALHHREGRKDGAATQLARSRAVLKDAGPLVSLVSACSLHLAEQAPELGVSDFATFADAHWPDELALMPWSGTVWVHESCSLRNGLKEHGALQRLLARVPDIDLRPLGDPRLCCGAAGTHLLSHRQQADAIGAEKLAGIGADSRGVLITTNTGCALHLQQGLKRRGLAVEVMHPARFLAALL